MKLFDYLETFVAVALTFLLPLGLELLGASLIDEQYQPQMMYAGQAMGILAAAGVSIDAHTSEMNDKLIGIWVRRSAFACILCLILCLVLIPFWFGLETLTWRFNLGELVWKLAYLGLWISAGSFVGFICVLVQRSSGK